MGVGTLVLPLTGVAFPGRIMHCTVFYPLDLYPAFFGYYFFNFMMVVLQSLHIFWAYLIIRMAQKFITGKVRGTLGPWGWRMGLCRGDPQILESPHGCRGETEARQENEEQLTDPAFPSAHRWWRMSGVTVRRRTTRRRRRRWPRTGPSPMATLSSTTTTAKPTECPGPESCHRPSPSGRSTPGPRSACRAPPFRSGAAALPHTHRWCPSTSHLLP